MHSFETNKEGDTTGNWLTTFTCKMTVHVHAY